MLLCVECTLTEAEVLDGSLLSGLWGLILGVELA